MLNNRTARADERDLLTVAAHLNLVTARPSTGHTHSSITTGTEFHTDSRGIVRPRHHRGRAGR